MGQKVNGKQVTVWEELGRHTLSSGATSMSVSFTAKKYIKILVFIPIQTGGVNTNEYIRFNNDSGNNYDHRTVIAGSGSTLVTATSGIYSYGDTNATSTGEFTLFNLATTNKALFGRRQVSYPNGGSGVTYVDVGGVWRNATNAVSRIDYVTTAGGFGAGSEMIILGHD